MLKSDQVQMVVNLNQQQPEQNEPSQENSAHSDLIQFNDSNGTQATIFEKYWSNIEALVRKLLRNEPVDSSNWQNIFTDIYMICSWDEQGCEKLLNGIKHVLLESFLHETKLKIESIQDGQLQLREYISNWMEYKRYCLQLPVAFQQLDLAIRTSPSASTCLKSVLNSQNLQQQSRIAPLSQLSVDRLSSSIKSLSNYKFAEKSTVRCHMLNLWDDYILRPHWASITDPELLAHYCDLLFRKTQMSRKLSLKEVSERLDEGLLIIRLIKNKDIFMKNYTIHLIRRLILDSSISLEKEEKYLNDLREVAAMPMEHTYKLHRMLKDLRSSSELQLQFRKTLEASFCNGQLNNNNNNNNNITYTMSSPSDKNLIPQEEDIRVPLKQYDEVHFKVLNHCSWSMSNNKQTVTLPSELTKILNEFESFYTKCYTERKLEWCHRLSNGIVSFTSDKGRYDLEITGTQLSILSAFDKQPGEPKSLRDLEELTCLNNIELKRTLWSLVANPKLKLQPIIGEPAVNDIKDLEQDVIRFSINKNFSLIKYGKPQASGRVSLIGRLQL